MPDSKRDVCRRCLILKLLLASLVAGPARAWELQGQDGPDPSLWAYGDRWLANPDPNAMPVPRRATALLSVQCQNGQPAVFVNHNFEVEFDRASIALQLDDGPVVEQVWTGSSGIDLAPPDPRAFVSTLNNHQRLHLTVTWPGAAPTATTFVVAGLDKAIGPLQGACGW